MTKRVGLLGPYSSRNLGDTAIQGAVIARLRKHDADIEPIGICPEPDDTRRTHGIQAFPLEPHSGRACGTRILSLAKIFAFVGTLDALIISGGGQLDEFWGGPWGHPFSLWAWTWCASLRGVPVAVLGVGLDRIDTRLSRLFVGSVLKRARYRAFRDWRTLDHLRTLGLRAPSEVCPDLAFTLDRNGRTPVHLPAAPYAIVSPIAAATWTHDAAEEDEPYFAACASASIWLMNRGLRVRFVCTQSKMDRSAVERVTALIDERYDGRWEVRDIEGVDAYLQEARAARVVLASRLHGAILAFVAGTPVVAVAPLPKVSQLMLELDLSQCCMDLRDVSITGLVARLEYTLHHETAMREHIRARTAHWRAALDEVFTRMTAALAL
ncbi:MAG TPA: polysaccharide pyruvyl transferase family protein [Burkholderiaceae bacterium]|nr:polysaccharide pyruvyl transferase family protein [Burkholderiaceae bacterium]